MKFFDYKFLILLGLTLKVYFIYREVEYLRSKVNKIENELNQKKITNESVSVATKIIEPVLQLPSIKNNIQSEKVINLDLVTQSSLVTKQLPSNKSSLVTKQLPSDKSSLGTKLPSDKASLHQELYTLSEDNDDELYTSHEEQNNNTTTEDESESESSKHLAIYSNDNEQFDSAQNSLIDSVEANKLNDDNVNLKSTMENIINDLSSETEKSNKLKQQEINDIIFEKDKQLSEMSSKSSELLHNSDQNKSKFEEPKKLKEDELNELKLVDIKNMALKLGITFSRKINGSQKTKTKQELIQDILQNNKKNI